MRLFLCLIHLSFFMSHSFESFPSHSFVYWIHIFVILFIGLYFIDQNWKLDRYEIDILVFSNFFTLVFYDII